MKFNTSPYKPPKIPQFPYNGLNPFDENDHLIFFGRDAHIEAILEKLESAQQHFIAIVGQSGSGKSSLVKAGVLPRLEGSHAQTHWAFAVMRPGDKPLANLAEALGVATNSVATLTPTGAWDRLLTEAQVTDNSNLLLLVDQFEELFRPPYPSPQEVSRFLWLLLSASEHDRVYIVLTMRSEFLEYCAKYPEFTDTINRSSYLIPHLQRWELKKIIQAPPRLGQFDSEIDDELVETLLNEVTRDIRHYLPALGPLLDRVWRHVLETEKPYMTGTESLLQLEGGTLQEQEDMQQYQVTLKHYQTVGTLEKSIEVHAEAVFNSLVENEQHIAESVFRALISRDDNKETRSPSAITSIAQAYELDVQQLLNSKAIKRFRAEGFLQPAGKTRLQPDTVLDITHEVIIWKWPRLNAWLDVENKTVELYKTLKKEVADWQKNQQAIAFLRIGEKLVAAQDWLSGYPPKSSAWAWRYEHKETELDNNSKEDQEEILKQRANAHLANIKTYLAACEQHKQKQEEKQRREAQEKEDRQRKEIRERWMLRVAGVVLIGLFLLVMIVSIAWQTTEKARISEETARIDAENARDQEKQARLDSEYKSQLEKAVTQSSEVYADFSEAHNTLTKAQALEAQTDISLAYKQSNRALLAYTDLMSQQPNQTYYIKDSGTLFSLALAKDAIIAGGNYNTLAAIQASAIKTWTESL